MLINQGCLTNVTQFHEWNSVIFASAKTHRNPRIHIISLLDSFLEKMFPKQRRLLTHYFFFRSEKYTQVTVKSKKDADMHDTLALERFSFS